MIKIFIDTEFTKLPIPTEWHPDPTNHISLISLGLIEESGINSFYAELSEGWEKKDCSEFTIETVLPLLQGGEVQRTKDQLSKDLYEWLERYEDRIVFYCDFIVDWYFVRNLLKDRPILIDYELISYWAPDEQVAHEWMLTSFFDPIKRPRHHSLNDAMGLRESWLYISAGKS